jgi:hypothetical protein
MAIIIIILSILAHVAAHSSPSGHTYPTHPPLFRPLIFGIAPIVLPFHHAYLEYPHAASTTEHVLLALFAGTAHPTMSRLVHLVDMAAPHTCCSYSPCGVTVPRGKMNNSALDRFLIQWIHTYGHAAQCGSTIQYLPHIFNLILAGAVTQYHPQQVEKDRSSSTI